MTRFITGTLLVLAIGGYTQADLLIQDNVDDLLGHRESREGQLAGSLEAVEAILVCFFPPLSPPPSEPPAETPPEEPPEPPEPPEDPPEEPPVHYPEPTTWIAGTIGGLICAVRWWRRRR